METKRSDTAHYHLPGLFEFYEFYRVFLPFFRENRDCFYEWCDIGSIYGAPPGCIWGGGRIEESDVEAPRVLELMKEHGISARLTFSNSLLTEKHLHDKKCNEMCALFEHCDNISCGVIVHSDLLLRYLQSSYPKLYLVSSATKVITDFQGFAEELNRGEFRYVVPDFRLNKQMDCLNQLTSSQKDKVELLCNECCYFGCKDRKKCYEAVSRKNLGERTAFKCKAPEGEEGYRFYKAMRNPGFIGTEDIVGTYMPAGFRNFKIEGRGLGSALLLEFILFYMTKPEHHMYVRERIYLDNMLDLF